LSLIPEAFFPPFMSFKLTPSVLSLAGLLIAASISEGAPLTQPTTGGKFKGSSLIFGRSAVGQIGEPVRRYTVIPLEEPVSPTHEPIVPPPLEKSPITVPPVRNPEPEPVR
jgi:hypothetical protein